jgi:hypothetical protein
MRDKNLETYSVLMGCLTHTCGFLAYVSRLFLEDVKVQVLGECNRYPLVTASQSKFFRVWKMLDILVVS